MRTRSRTLVVVGASLALAVPAAPAFATSIKQACEDEGGTFVKEQGTWECQFPVGKSDNVKTLGEGGTATNPGGHQPPGQQDG